MTQKHTLDDLQKLCASYFPRSLKYDPEWVIENEMGPNALWLTEFLTDVMDLQDGMRVLDLGCGKALSSVFLVKEFGVEVVAVDLWTLPEDNLRRIREAGVEDKVTPLHASAEHLPFTNNSFDAILSIDAFEYFGTSDTYLPGLVRYLKPGGQIGIVNAGLINEIDELPSEWPDDFKNFHSVEWWKRLWLNSGTVDVESAEDLPRSRELWLRWNKIIGEVNDTYLTCEAGANLSFHRLIGRRSKPGYGTI